MAFWIAVTTALHLEEKEDWEEGLTGEDEYTEYTEHVGALRTGEPVE
jgi:hypothetical protein